MLIFIKIALDFDQTITPDLGQGSPFIAFGISQQFVRGEISSDKLINNITINIQGLGKGGSENKNKE